MLPGKQIITPTPIVLTYDGNTTITAALFSTALPQLIGSPTDDLSIVNNPPSSTCLNTQSHMKTISPRSLPQAIGKHFLHTPSRLVAYTSPSLRMKSILRKHPIMVQKHVDFVETTNHSQPGIHNIESPEQDLIIPDL
jgi:hypothetical protein